MRPKALGSGENRTGVGSAHLLSCRRQPAFLVQYFLPVDSNTELAQDTAGWSSGSGLLIFSRALASVAAEGRSGSRTRRMIIVLFMKCLLRGVLIRGHQECTGLGEQEN